MAIQKTDAVLLKKRDLRETSLILTFFTRDFGKVHGVLKGARGTRARTSANPLFFSLDHIVFYEKKNSDLFIISQCDALKTFLNVLRDWDRASVAYYILELVDVFTEPGESIEPIFEGLLNSLMLLDGNKDPGVIARLFEVKFLMVMGLWPGAEDLKLSKGSLSTLACFEKDSWQTASKINLTRDVGEEIKKITSSIIADNLDRPLKTASVFK
ncbi:MAG: DNA repair protein RecO [Candidatus Omnitrophica bacterium]|nr:DNA repair protein RecO [Candidatus Omnitrophota bacterium]